MPKKLLATTIILSVILTLGVSLQVVEVTEANPFNLKPVYDIISIQSPQNNGSYTNPISLNFTVKRSGYTTACVYYYTLDGKPHTRISNIEILQQKEIKNDINPSPPEGFGPYYFPYTDYTLEGNTVLPYLAEGWHNLTVYELGSATVSFYVNANSESSNLTLNISPVPSLSPTITPSYSSTLEPSKKAFQEKLIAIQQSYILGVIIVVVLIGLGVLFYYKRRRGKP